MANYQMDTIEAARANIAMLNQAYADSHITQEEAAALKLIEKNIVREELKLDPSK